MLTLKITHEGTTKEVQTKPVTVEELLTTMKINPETVIVAIDKEVVPDTAQIEKNCSLDIINVISGG